METMPLADLFANYKDGDEHGWATEFHLLMGCHALELKALLESVRQDGIKKPILLGNDGRVWDGHHRLCVAKALGLSDVPVERVD